MTKTKSLILKIIFVLGFMLCALAFLFTSIPVNAEAKVIMKDGASIRFDEPTGIRFSAYVSDTYFSNGKLKDGVEVGMLLVQEGKLEGINSDGDDNIIDFGWGQNTSNLGLTPDNNSSFIKKVSSSDPSFVWAGDDDVDGMVRFNAVVKNIPAIGYAQTIVARAYVINNGVQVLSDKIVKRSISEVANKILSEDLILNGEKLADDQRTELKNYVVATNALSDVAISSIDNGIASWDAVDGAIGYYVRFGEEMPIFTTETEYDIEDSDYVWIVAVGDGKNYTRSNIASLDYFTQAAREINYEEGEELVLSAGTPPSSYFLSPESGEPYKAAGFNEFVIGITESSTAEGVALSLQRCKDAGMAATIQLHNGLIKRISEYDSVQDLGANDPGNVFISILGNMDFTDTPVKTFMIDEPSYTQLLYIEKVYVPWFNQNYGGQDSERYFMINLFGGYSTGIALRITDPHTGQEVTYETEEGKARIYELYQEKYLSIIESQNTTLKIYSQDSYPFSLVETDQGGNVVENNADDYVKSDWLFRTYRGAKAAAENDLGYQTYIQVFSSEHFACRMPETLAEVKWQAYMYLAFGSKCLEYFSYETRVGGDLDIYGMTNVVDGKVVYLPSYYFVKDTNAELKKFQNVLMAYDNWIGLKSFVGTGNAKCDAFKNIADMELDSLTGVSSVVTDQDLIIGEMVDGSGNHGYMMVGYEDPIFNNNTTVSMTFDDADGLIIYRNGERSLSDDLVNGQFSITLTPGEGVFVIPVYA